jgi:predicted nucleotidyltransferase
MATIRLPPDFREFLLLLNSEGIEYLLVGGYAVSYYGYPRSTGDMDIWIAATPANAAALTRTLECFGFSVKTLSDSLFLGENKVVRMGVPPVCIDLLTSVSGVDFTQCYAHRTKAVIDGVKVNVIGLDHLKINKQTIARSKDLDDLEHLP